MSKNTRIGIGCGVGLVVGFVVSFIMAKATMEVGLGLEKTYWFSPWLSRFSYDIFGHNANLGV